MNQLDQQDPTPVPPKGTDIVIAFQKDGRTPREIRYNINVPTVPGKGDRFTYIDGQIEHRGEVTDVHYALINKVWTITVTVEES